MQECHILKEDLAQWKRDWDIGNVFINPYSNRSAGQAILLKQKQDLDDHKILLEGRIQTLKVTLFDTKITLMNVYGPNNETERGPFLNKLRDILNRYDYGDTVILGGDFNFVPDFKLDKYSKGKNMNLFEASKAQKELESFKKCFI